MAFNCYITSEANFTSEAKMKLTIGLIEHYKDKDLSCKEIADLLGIKLSRVYVFCKRNGILLRRELRGGKNAKDMTGKVIGSLTVKKRAGSIGKLALWECVCVCGNTVTYRGSDLRQNKIKTCGCRVGIESKRNWSGFGFIPKGYWSSLVRNAENRNIKFGVTIEELNSLFVEQGKICKLSGMPISFEDGTASLDRIDNSKGYVKFNVQWLHKDVNKIKSTLQQQYFVSLCKLIAQKG